MRENRLGEGESEERDKQGREVNMSWNDKWVEENWKILGLVWKSSKKWSNSYKTQSLWARENYWIYEGIENMQRLGDEEALICFQNQEVSEANMEERTEKIAREWARF